MPNIILIWDICLTLTVRKASRVYSSIADLRHNIMALPFRCLRFEYRLLGLNPISLISSWAGGHAVTGRALVLLTHIDIHLVTRLIELFLTLT